MTHFEFKKKKLKLSICIA